MEKEDGRQDRRSKESAKGKGKSKIPSVEPSKWAKYTQGGFFLFHCV